MRVSMGAHAKLPFRVARNKGSCKRSMKGFCKGCYQVSLLFLKTLV